MSDVCSDEATEATNTLKAHHDINAEIGESETITEEVISQLAEYKRKLNAMPHGYVNAPDSEGERKSPFSVDLWLILR